MEYVALLSGRILIGFYFFFFTFWNFYHRKAAISAIPLPLPHVIFTMGLFIQFVTGMCIMIGIFTAPSALILVVFDVVATFIFHRFWIMEEGPVRTLNTIIFIGNLTVTLGALLLVIGMSH